MVEERQMPVSRFGCAVATAAAVVIVLASPPLPAKEPSNMVKIRDAYPLITTPHLFETRDFYVKHFGFKPLFEASWFVYLAGDAAEGGRGATLAFMLPDHPSSPPGPEVFSGKGMILTVQVDDVAATHAALVKSGAPIVLDLKDEPWGQRRFVTRDPAGVLIDVVEQTEPQPGYWERFPAPR
jgi:catechol 2,3-dioxygenase-like lactoylglutathione lyase family enzyme